MSPHLLLVTCCLWLTTVTIHGGAPRVSESCKTTAECPVNAECQTVGCMDKLCVCQNGTLPNADKTECLRVVDLGAECTAEGLTCTKRAECSEGVCQCQSGFVKSDNEKRCKEQSYFAGEKYSLLNESCDDVNVYCEDARKQLCSAGKCECKSGNRPVTEIEFFSLPSFTECVPESFSIGEVIKADKCLDSVVDLGQKCYSNSNCPQNAECVMVGCDKKCKCMSGTITSDNFQSCLAVKELGDECDPTSECGTKYSYCKPEEGGVCTCHPSHFVFNNTCKRSPFVCPSCVKNWATLGEACGGDGVQCDDDLVCNTTTTTCGCKDGYRVATLPERKAFFLRGYCIRNELKIDYSEKEYKENCVTTTTTTTMTTVEDETTTSSSDETTTSSLVETSTSSVDETTTSPVNETTTSSVDETTTSSDETTTSSVDETTTSLINETTTSSVDETTTSSDVTTTSPVNETTTSPANETTTSPVDETTTSPANETTTSPANETTTSPVDETTTSPANETTTSPANETTTSSVDETTTSPVDETTTSPTNETTTSSVDETTTSPANKTTTSPVDETTTSPANETTTSSVDETTTSPLNETTTSSVDETTTSPLNETTTSPLNETTTSSVVETTTSLVNETTTSPVDEITTSSDVTTTSPVNETTTSSSDETTTPLVDKTTTLSDVTTTSPVDETTTSSDVTTTSLEDETTMTTLTSTQSEEDDVLTTSPAVTTTTTAATTKPAPISLDRPCFNDSSCPNNSVCGLYNCKRRCVCKPGYTEANQNSACIKGATLGEACDSVTVCSVPGSGCGPDGKCHCGGTIPRETTDGFCAPNNLKLVDEDCSSDSPCMAFVTECTGNVCKCMEGFRKATMEELYAEPDLWRELGKCREEGYSAKTKSVDSQSLCVVSFVGGGSTCEIVKVGDICNATRICPVHSTCISADGVCGSRCWCDSGFAPYSSTTLEKCVPVVVLGDACTIGLNRCGGYGVVCLGGTCKCRSGQEPSSNKFGCKPKPNKYYSLSQLGEACDRSKKKYCFDKANQVCQDGVCVCKSGKREATLLDIKAQYTNLAQCRGHDEPEGFVQNVTCIQGVIPLVADPPDFSEETGASGALVFVYVAVPAVVVVAAVLATVLTILRRSKQRRLLDNSSDCSSMTSQNETGINIPRPHLSGIGLFRGDKNWSTAETSYTNLAVNK